MKFSKAVVKCRIPILICALLLMVPSVLGMTATRVNYDMLNYLLLFPRMSGDFTSRGTVLSSRDLSIMYDLLFRKIKDRLPAVSGKRSRVTVFGFSLAGKVQTRSGCTFPARVQG